MYSGFTSNFSILSSTMKRGEIDFFFFFLFFDLSYFTMIFPSSRAPLSFWTSICAIQLSLSLSPVTVISFTLVLCVLFELSNDRTSLLKNKSYLYKNFVFVLNIFNRFLFKKIFFILFIFFCCGWNCLIVFFCPWLTWKFKISLSLSQFSPLVVSFYKKKSSSTSIMTWNNIPPARPQFSIFLQKISPITDN